MSFLKGSGRRRASGERVRSKSFFLPYRYTSMPMHNYKPKNPPQTQPKVSVTLTRDQMVALDRLVCRIRDSGGRRLPINAVLRAAVRLFLELKIDPNGCRDEDELFAALQRAVKHR